MQKVNRIEWIDWLKGLAIFCVVLGHLMPVLSAYAMDLSTINGSVNSIIMSFNMPLFAVLSGYFFSANIGVLDFLGKKCRQLAMPFIVWCFIVFVLYPNIKSLVYGERIYIFATLRNYYYGLIDWGWWFIRALFLCFIYAYFSVRLFRYNYLLAFVGSILFLCIISFLGIIPNKLHFSHGFIFLYPFFCFGHLLRYQLKNIIIDYPVHTFIISFLCWVLIYSTCWNGFPDTFYGMNTSIFAPSANYLEGWMIVYKTFVRLVIGCSSSLALISLFYLLESNYSILSQNKCMGLLKRFGQNTLGIYIIQSLIFDNVNSKFNIFAYHPWLNFILCFICSLIICILCMYIVLLLGKNNYLGLILWGNK